MSRTQIPLAPERVRTVQTAQGLSMDSATMFLQRPGNMNEDDWWLHVYVMIGWVRTSPQILVYGLPPLSLFQRGPPSFLAEGMNRLERLAAQHAILARRAREALGWSLRCESSQVSASSILPSVPEHKFDSDAGWAGMMHDPALSSRLLDPGADPETVISSVRMHLVQRVVWRLFHLFCHHLLKCQRQLFQVHLLVFRALLCLLFFRRELWCPSTCPFMLK